VVNNPRRKINIIIMSRQSLQAGFCEVENICALDVFDCDSFYSSRLMQTAALSHGGGCLQSNAVESISIGICKVADTFNSYHENNGRCANVKELCDLDNHEFFEPSSESCTISKDSNLNSATRYGSCLSHGECVWSPNDCESIDDFTGFDAKCSCDRVRVGACLKDGIAFCAVSEFACDEFATWVPAMELSLQEDIDTECYLCRDRSHNEINVEGVVSGGTFNNIDVPMYEMGVNKEVTMTNKMEEEGDDFATGIFVGGLFCVLGLAVLISMLAIRSGRKRRSKEVGCPPPKEVNCEFDTNHGVYEDRY